LEAVLNLLPLPPLPVLPKARRNRNTAAFDSFKKLASHFFNPHFVRTKSKEAANPVTDYDQNRTAVLCSYLQLFAVI